MKDVNKMLKKVLLDKDFDYSSKIPSTKLGTLSDSERSRGKLTSEILIDIVYWENY
ncbi:hypothetical protein [Gilliamella apicola]|uniref:hypothetical protein n=1 Tax=Gilliamella apicola TaxID=1196095 RepID=UPI0015528D8D|nr:hypothetical protein [Gilliamella apicola]